jgi:hypothetical protein
MNDLNVAQSLKVLNLKRDRYFYWTITKELIRPKFRGEGRGGRTRLSLMNLVELSLIKALVGLGVELNAIKNIIGAKVKPGHKTTPRRFTPFLEWAREEYQKEGRDYSGFYLFLYKDEADRWAFFVVYYLRDFRLSDIMKKFNPVIVFELFSIMKNLEQKTGLNF